MSCEHPNTAFSSGSERTSVSFPPTFTIECYDMYGSVRFDTHMFLVAPLYQAFARHHNFYLYTHLQIRTSGSASV